MKTENTRRTFTGYEFELESELHYAGARYYDPLLGQFLTHDPARQFPSPYAYGPGDPFNGTDPTGAEFFGSGGEGGGFTPIGDPFFNELGIPLPQFLFFMPQPPLAEETYTSVDAVVDPLDQFDNLVYRGRTGAGAPSAVAAQSTAGAAAQGAASPDAISGESPTTYFEALTDATDLGPRLGLYAGATFKIYGFGVTVDLDIASYNVDLVDRHDSKFTSGTEVSVDLLGLPLGFELFRREVEVGQVASPLRDLFSQPSHSGFLTPWDALGSGRDASGDFGRFDLKVGGLVGGNAGFDIRGFATDAIDIFRERRGR